MADQKLNIVIEAKDKTGKALDNLDKKIGKLSGSFKALGAAFVAAISIRKIGQIGGAFLKAADDFEQVNIAFTTMLGSADKATKLIEDLAQFAAKTPFELKDVEKGAKGLLAFGIETDNILPTLKALGDVSAGLSVPIERLILNYGQVAAQTKLTGRELRDFAIAGVPLLGTLADQLGVSKATISDMVSEGEIGFPLVEKAFRTMSDEGGKFNDLMDKQSKTFSGAVSNLKDQIDLYMRDAGGPLIEVGKTIVKGLTGMVVALRESGSVFEIMKEKMAVGLKFIDDNTGIITILKQSFENVATVFRENLLPQLKLLFEALKPLMPFIKTFAEIVGVILLGAFIALVKFIEISLLAAITVMTDAVQVAIDTVAFFKDIWDAVTDSLAKAITKIDEVIDKVKKLNVLQGAKNFVAGVLGFGGERADGGPVQTGKTFLVGERGPELFTPNSSGSIISNDKLGGKGTVINFNIQGDVVGEETMSKMFDEAVRNLQLSSAIVG